MIGEKLLLTATIGTINAKAHKICLNAIRSTEHGFTKHHAWVDDTKEFEQYGKGDIIMFTAIVYYYRGHCEDSQEVIQKTGLGKIRQVKKLEELT